MEIANVKEVQARLIEMADTVTGILTRHGFRYLIAYGSLLGAVRHQGFVPWDDDLDLYLFDEEYDLAMEILRAELPEDLIVHDRLTDALYWKSWSCLRDLKTEVHCSLHEDDNAFKYRGLSVDLFRLRKMPAREFGAYLDRENIEFLVRKLDSGTMDRAVYEQKLADAVQHYAGELSKLQRGEGSEEEIYGFLIYGFHAPEDWIFPLKKYPFAGREYWGPNNADAILTQYYRDYMTLPPPEKRRPHYDSVDFLD